MTESRWQSWGRNTLLTLGLTAAFGMTLMLMTFIESLFLGERIFRGAGGAALLHSLGALPALLTAAVVGYVAAYLLTFRGASIAVLGVGVFWALWLYKSGHYFGTPEWWSLAIDAGKAFLVPLLMALLFMRKRRSLEVRPSP